MYISLITMRAKSLLLSRLSRSIIRFTCRCSARARRLTRSRWCPACWSTRRARACPRCRRARTVSSTSCASPARGCPTDVRCRRCSTSLSTSWTSSRRSTSFWSRGPHPARPPTHPAAHPPRSPPLISRRKLKVYTYTCMYIIHPLFYLPYTILISFIVRSCMKRSIDVDEAICREMALRPLCLPLWIW